MIDGNLLDRLDRLARRLRRPDLPFGGIQVRPPFGRFPSRCHILAFLTRPLFPIIKMVFSGDFYQVWSLAHPLSGTDPYALVHLCVVAPTRLPRSCSPNSTGLPRRLLALRRPASRHSHSGVPTGGSESVSLPSSPRNFPR